MPSGFGGTGGTGGDGGVFGELDLDFGSTSTSSKSGNVPSFADVGFVFFVAPDPLPVDVGFGGGVGIVGLLLVPPGVDGPLGFELEPPGVDGPEPPDVGVELGGAGIEPPLFEPPSPLSFFIIEVVFRKFLFQLFICWSCTFWNWFNTSFNISSLLFDFR